MNKKIKLNNGKELVMEKYLVKDLKEDLENSPVLELENEELKSKLNKYEDNEELIIKYKINPSKKIYFLENVKEILKNC